MSVRIPYLLVILWALAAPSLAIGQEASDMEALSDRELVEVLFRDDAKEEVRRRLQTYDADGRRRLEILILEGRKARSFPASYSNTELLKALIDESLLRHAHAIESELKTRYSAMSAQERNEFLDTITNIATELSSESPGDSDDRQMVPSAKYRVFAMFSANVLTEEDAIVVLRRLLQNPAMYDDDSGFVHAIVMYRGQNGAISADALEQLYHEVSSRPVSEKIKNPSIRREIITALGLCGAPGMDVLKRIGWHSEEGVRAMGRVATPDARDALLARYRELPESAERPRSVVLSALCARLYHEDDLARSFVREHLPGFLRLSENLSNDMSLMQALRIVEVTRDPYFVPYLEDIEGILERPESQGFLKESIDEPGVFVDRRIAIWRMLGETRKSLSPE